MVMNADEIRDLVWSQLSSAWDTSNAHGVNLQQALVPPEPITVIERTVRDGRMVDRLVDVWLVLVEDAKSGTGYRVVAAKDGSLFGLATKGFPGDKHLVLCGWYGDFVTTLQDM